MKRFDFYDYILITFVILLLIQTAYAKGQCDEADLLRDLKSYAKAEEAYAVLLKNDSSLDCAKSGLSIMKEEQVRNLFETGRSYEKAGNMEKAKEVYIEVLKIDPKHNQSEQALLGLNGGIITLVHYWLSTRIEPFLFILIIILILWRLIFFFFPLLNFRPRLDFQDFDKGETDFDIGKTMAALVKDNIKRFERESHLHQSFDAVQGPVGKLEIPAEIKSTSQPIKYLSALIELLYRPEIITISGFLEKPGKKGAGLTLLMVKSNTGSIIASQTIWEKEFYPEIPSPETKENDPEIYYRLVEPAATWVVFQLNTSSNSISTSKRLKNHISSLIGHSDDFKILNTGDWKSYAYFRAGVSYYEDNNSNMTRKMYLKALDYDPDNVGALHNLGFIDIFIENEEQNNFDRGLEKLERITNIIKPENEEVRFVWLTAFHNLALGYSCKSNSDLIEGDEKSNARIIANEKAKMLYDKVIELRGTNSNKDKILKTFYLKALIIYAYTLSNLRKYNTGNEKYNISITPEELIEKLVCQLSIENGSHIEINNSNYLKLSHDSRYNLACYYSIAGENTASQGLYTKALIFLEYAFEAKSHYVKLALKDKDLEGVRTGKKKEDFDKLILKYIPRE